MLGACGFGHVAGWAEEARVEDTVVVGVAPEGLLMGGAEVEACRWLVGVVTLVEDGRWDGDDG